MLKVKKPYYTAQSLLFLLKMSVQYIPAYKNLWVFIQGIV